ncbi:urokinase plasminogen activator surface receptor-like isoform X2 [Heterodontus francisci]|uniref:urokinase plasminogen activator surface receptor-like isoform X2 n=1 Tax=Heterodontus francisci TaxID=7792 RepID=UPI00355B63EA
MKVLLGAVLLIALVTEASALKCFSCVSPTGNCTQQEVVCNPALNLNCRTVFITQTNGARNSSLFVKDCGNCSEPSSFNVGSFAQFLGFNCCRSDLCNDLRHQVNEDTTLNGLECFGCNNDSAATCSSSTSVLKCVGIQNRCIHVSVPQFDTGKYIVRKGCASESNCRSPQVNNFGVQTSSDFHCCKESLCNNETTLPGLQCHSCSGTPGSCQPLTIQCTSSSCKSFYLKEVNAGHSNELVIRGCGNCTGRLSFRSGTFSVNLADSCCQSDLCNNQTIAEANTTFSGLECYGCVAVQNNACENPKDTVKCVGEQTWCLHSSTTNNLKQNGTIKGCASKSFCQNPDILNLYGLQPKQDFYCCKGNGCNLRNRSSEVSTAQTTTSTDTMTTRNNSPAIRALRALLLIAMMSCLF